MDTADHEFSLLVNFPVSDAIYDAPADPERAADVLRLAAEFLRNRQPMPYALADYLADAFESAISKPAEHRAPELGHELNLTARNRRPVKFGWIKAYMLATTLAGKPQSEIVAAIMRAGGISRSSAYSLLKRAQTEMEKERQRRLRDDF